MSGSTLIQSWTIGERSKTFAPLGSPGDGLYCPAVTSSIVKPGRRGQSLRQCVGLALLLSLAAGFCLSTLFGLRSRQALQEAAQARLRTTASWTEERVRGLLQQPLDCMGGLVMRFQNHLLRDEPAQLEAAFRGELLERPLLTEVSFTDTAGRQTSVWLGMEGGIQVTRTVPVGRGFRKVSSQAPPCWVADPRSHLTYSTLTSREYLGKMLWSDLHYSQLDSDLPEGMRRVVVSVQQAVLSQGKTLGVIRVSLDTQTLNREVKDAAPEGHQLFLCDQEGRLVTSVNRSDRLVETPDEELRWQSGFSSVARALAQGLPLPGYLVHLRPVEAGQRYWQVGVVVNEDTYLGALNRARRDFLWLFFATTGLIAGFCLALFRKVDSDLNFLQREASAVEAYQIQPGRAVLHFREFGQISLALQAAGVSMETLSKFAPTQLVRKLHAQRQEPRLGGQLTQVSMLFSDLENFTSMAERMSPDRLGEVLGQYFAAVTQSIHQHGGIVDKYIGDAVMALFNVPEPLEDHEICLCRAALAHREASKQVWAQVEEAEAMRVCLGLHSDRVTVGNFGAPDRMSYTALGDGVNLASRLEGLNRLYGSEIIVSEAVYLKSSQHFQFRKLDSVVVKGKTRPVDIFELLRERTRPDEPAPVEVVHYEEALQLYQAGKFHEALLAFERLPGDRPAVTLSSRCRSLLKEPPAEWRGVYQVKQK